MIANLHLFDGYKARICNGKSRYLHNFLIQKIKIHVYLCYVNHFSTLTVKKVNQLKLLVPLWYTWLQNNVSIVVNHEYEYQHIAAWYFPPFICLSVVDGDSDEIYVKDDVNDVSTLEDIGWSIYPVHLREPAKFDTNTINSRKLFYDQNNSICLLNLFRME